MTKHIPTYVRATAVAMLALALTACAGLFTKLEPPMVNVENVRSLPSEEMGPRFEITLRIANPNATALDIAGISYTIDVFNRSLISGVTAEVPRIEPYSEGVVKLEAGVNLIQALRLLGDLGVGQHDSIDYRFAAKIDFSGLLPTQRVEESGSLTLR